MDKKELLKLEKIYSELPDEKLAGLLLADQSESEPEAYDLLLAEGRKRNIGPKVIELKKEKESETPFRWGNFVIGVGFLQGVIAFIFGGILGIKTEYLPNRIYSIILGLISLSYAFGLMKRKRWGLNILLICFIWKYP